MELIADNQQFYIDHNIKNHLDHRSEEEKTRQSDVIDKISQRNLEAMQVKLTEKRSVKYKARPLHRIDLGQGVYCYITDNDVKSEQAIMAFHGVPGSCSEWAGIEAQMKEQVRWVNFAIPGFDGEDERRGNYVGDYQALLQLIIKLKRKLSIKRLIACGHSYGSSIAFNLKDKYPQEVEGYINLAGIINYWSFGITLIYRLCIAEFKYYDREWNSKQPFNKDEERQKIHQKYVELYKEKNYAKYSIPFFNKNQLMAYIKLTNFPVQYQDYSFNRLRNLPGLRLLVYGKNDPLHSLEKIEATLHYLLFQEKSYINKPEYKKLFNAAKLSLEARLKERFGIQVEGEKIQDYFCLILDNTGHAIHRRRPEELSRLISVYVTALQVLHQQSQLLRSRL